MNRVKKFLKEHKEAVIVTTAAVAVTTCAITAKVMLNGKVVTSAYFDPYNSETDAAAIMHLEYRNGKTQLVTFETKK